MTNLFDIPGHPLVVDERTKLYRLADQDDIRRMERICELYHALVRDLRRRLDDDMRGAVGVNTTGS